jgi:hypothetical protein
MSFGAPPSFVSLPPPVHDAKPVHVIGRGTPTLINQFVIAQIRALRMAGWERSVCNAPNRALDGLRVLWNCLYGLRLTLDEFSLTPMRVHHSFALPSGAKLYASDSYKGCSRHDFLKCVDCSFARLVAIVSVEDVLGSMVPFVILETARVEVAPRLSVLQPTVIVSETDEWRWHRLDAISEPVVGLCHGADRAWHFIIPSKRDIKFQV